MLSLEKQDSSEDEEADMEEVRRFKEELLADEKELLPLKIDGELIRRIEKLDKSEMNNTAELDDLEEGSDIEEDTGKIKKML